jgi:glyoxylase-like metal-dependent hydrolase (beta-lactamase superfamily II)
MAIETLSSRQSAAWRDRVLPPVERVAEGVWAVPVPIPDNPLVYTYCYAIADGSGVVLIDPGWDGKDQYKALTSALADLGFKVSDIHGIAITHYHRDHIGLVPALLAKNPSAWVAMHGEDLRSIKRFYTNAVDLGTGSTRTSTSPAPTGSPRTAGPRSKASRSARAARRPHTARQARPLRIAQANR